MFKRTITALAATAALAGGALAIAPSAQAAPAGCSSGALCAYYHSSYGSVTGHGVQQVFQDNANLTGYYNFYYIQGGSLFNNGNSCNVMVYTDTSRHGTGYQLNRGTGWPNIGTNLTHVSSNYWC